MKILSWVAFKTILRKEVIRFSRIWIQTLVPPVITMTLYFVIFGQLIGARIGEMHGFSYMQFIVPGLIMMSTLTNSFANVASSFFSAKFTNSIEELIVSPVSSHIIIIGYVVGGMLRGLIVGVLVTLISLFFVSFEVHSWGIIFVVLLMTSATFALGGLLNAILANSFEDINILPTFVLTPLTYLGGVFYSISLLPPFWQMVSKVNPIVYMVSGFRYGFLGIQDVNIYYTFSVLVLFMLILYGVVYAFMQKGIGIKH